MVQRTTHSIYCELRSLPCSVKYLRAVVLEEMACSPVGAVEAVSRPVSLALVVSLVIGGRVDFMV